MIPTKSLSVPFLEQGRFGSNSSSNQSPETSHRPYLQVNELDHLVLDDESDRQEKESVSSKHDSPKERLESKKNNRRLSVEGPMISGMQNNEIFQEEREQEQKIRERQNAVLQRITENKKKKKRINIYDKSANLEIFKTATKQKQKQDAYQTIDLRHKSKRLKPLQVTVEHMEEVELEKQLEDPFAFSKSLVHSDGGASLPVADRMISPIHNYKKVQKEDFVERKVTEFKDPQMLPLRSPLIKKAMPELALHHGVSEPYQLSRKTMLGVRNSDHYPRSPISDYSSSKKYQWNEFPGNTYVPKKRNLNVKLEPIRSMKERSEYYQFGQYFETQTQDSKPHNLGSHL